MREHKQNWLDVFSSFRVALDARKIILGTLGVYVTVIVLLGLLTLAGRQWPGAQPYSMQIIQNPVRVLPQLACAVCNTICAGPTLGQWAFMGFSGMLMLFIWAFFGGAVVRLAAVDFAKGERPEMGAATAFAARKFGSFFWSPLVPLIFVGLFLLCNVALGWVGRLPYAGPVIVGVFFFLAALSSFLVLILLIGAYFGFPFMWPTIAMEGTDAFDAISRSFNYLFARPWKVLWCWLVAGVHGMVTTAFVVLFVVALLAIALTSVGAGMGSDFQGGIMESLISPTVPNGMPRGIAAAVSAFCGFGLVPAEGQPWPMLTAMLLVRVLVILAWGLVLGFLVSYKMSAFAVIYSVLRRDVDGTDMSEVYVPESEEPMETPATPTEPTPETGAGENKPTA